MNFGVRTVRKSEECAKTHLRAPGSQKKKFQGYAPWRGGKAGRKGEGKGRLDLPPNFETVVAPLRLSRPSCNQVVSDCFWNIKLTYLLTTSILHKWALMSHSTQNKLFWRCSSQPISWLVLRKQNQNWEKQPQKIYRDAPSAFPLKTAFGQLDLRPASAGICFCQWQTIKVHVNVYYMLCQSLHHQTLSAITSINPGYYKYKK